MLAGMYISTIFFDLSFTIFLGHATSEEKLLLKVVTFTGPENGTICKTVILRATPFSKS